MKNMIYKDRGLVAKRGAGGARDRIFFEKRRRFLCEAKRSFYQQECPCSRKTHVSEKRDFYGKIFR